MSPVDIDEAENNLRRTIEGATYCCVSASDCKDACADLEALVTEARNLRAALHEIDALDTAFVVDCMEIDAVLDRVLRWKVDRLWKAPPGPIQAVESVRERYQEDVFPPPAAGCAVDRYSAAGARLACDAVLRLLRGEE